MFDNLQEDWHTAEGDTFRQGFWAMVVYRYGCWRDRLRPCVLRVPVSGLYNIMQIGVEITTGIDLPDEVTLGRRVRDDHLGA